ncbi:unnamed protein product [Cuscuta epithymum]|nr:unnamed protein product [Cuscuta epithymum]
MFCQDTLFPKAAHNPRNYRNQTESREILNRGPPLLEHQRDAIDCLQVRPNPRQPCLRPKTGETEDGWRTVNRGRRHPPHLNQRLPTHQLLFPDPIWVAENSNCYLSLGFDYEIPISTQPYELDGEPDLSSNLNGKHRTREKNNHDKRLISDTRRIAIDRQRCDKGKTSSATSAPGTSTPAAPSVMESGPTVDNLTSISGAPLVVRHAEETHTPGNAQPLTWADIVRFDADKKQLSDISEPAHVSPSKDRRIIIKELDYTLMDPVEIIQEVEACEKYSFFAEDGFDSIKIESKMFKFALQGSNLVLFEIKNSQLRKMEVNLDIAPRIICFMSQLTNLAQPNLKQSRRFGDITVCLETNRSGCYVKIFKHKGSSINIPVGHKKSSLLQFINIFSNFVGITKYVQDDSINLQLRSTIESEDPTSISKLILNSQIQGQCTENQNVISSEKEPELPRIQAYSDASDSFDYSDDSFFADDFLGHATESDRRPPISYPEEIRKSKFNREICSKANFVTSENCLPTDNLNKQLKIYKKSQKNKRRHSMKTRSQSRDFPWE